MYAFVSKIERINWLIKRINSSKFFKQSGKLFQMTVPE